MSDARNAVLDPWRRLQGLPGGRSIFSWLIGRKARYTGTISARVEELAAGFCKVRMRDRRRLRNHLASIHAVALVNLGELATGLAINAAMPPDARGIPIRLEVEFLKKARGEITAECRCDPPSGNERREHEIVAVLEDAAGDRVARVTARWLVGPKG